VLVNALVFYILRRKNMKRKIYNVTIKIKFETSINENPAAEIINSKDDRKKNI